VNRFLGRLLGKHDAAPPSCAAEAAALVATGLEQHRAGRMQDALGCYGEALAADSANFAATHLAGLAYQQLGQQDEALRYLGKAVRLNPGNREALTHLGNLHTSREEWVEAAQAFRRLTELDASFVGAWCDLATALLKLERYEEAVTCCAKALALDPQHVPSHIQLGVIRRNTGDIDRAEALYRSALTLQPDSDVARYNLAMIVLLRGDYREGLSLFESRFEAIRGTSWLSPQHAVLLRDPRRWQGGDLTGQRLLVWTEQGFGDMLMMLRYLPLLKARGASEVIVHCEPALVRLVLNVPGVDATLSCKEDAPQNRYDAHVPIMSLAALFDTRAGSIPGPVPCIAVPTDMADAWGERLASTSGVRVGLAYAGARQLADDAKRSIPLHKFERVLNVPDCTFFSLQKGEAQAQIANANGHIVDWMDECADFLDTAALTANLDLVISVDTAVAHLAGALGVPVWLLNRHGSEWRWGLAGETTPWYPTMRIFRQRDAASWDGVLSEVASELARTAKSARA